MIRIGSGKKASLFVALKNIVWCTCPIVLRFFGIAFRLGENIYMKGKYTFSLLLTIIAISISGCATMSQKLSMPLMQTEMEYGDPGQINVKVNIMRANMASHVGGTIDLDLVSKTIYDVLVGSKSFKQLSLGGDEQDYTFIPTVVLLTDIFDNVVHLKIQARNNYNKRIIYDHKFVGWNFSQSLSLNNIADLIKNDLSNIRAAINTDMHKTIATEKSFRPKSVSPEQYRQPQLISSLDLHRQSWAVIIGISKYRHSGQSGLANLIFADNDAKAFERVLSDLGWSDSHIMLLVNEEATQRNILIALESWLTKAGPNDQIVLYWAGHGFTDPEDPEKVYFACYDTDIKIPATGYRMDRVRSILEERKAKNVIVLADTCHAGKIITRGDRGLSIVPNIEKMSREQNIPKGWIFMVGADTDRQAIEHTSWTNGAFTHSLIKGLSGEADGFQSAGAKDGIVTMGELRSYMNTAMPDETQKVLGVAKRPVITTSTGDPDIWNLTLQAK